ncbi:NUDIX domain-containing protein [Natronomonas marina]|jgi:8-oxo-dGTP diphosphatase|uniref:NUDIX domain-containing protein n=1 Tax=Natronomonas marina TaxID=2961939 RepID=UPI0020C9BCFE|nr:NUDIX domain-containing protein [Natronomonas marina]
MTKRKPNYCPYCGTALMARTFEERERRFCPTCGEFVFQNPVPVGRVVVLDGDRALFVERARPPYQGTWTIPGGVLEVDESAALGATRELREETGVGASAKDLELVYTDVDVDDDGSILTVCFAVERDRTTGTPRVGDEPSAVEFREPGRLVESGEETRPLDRRCLEAAFERVRDEEREFTPRS